MSIRRKIVVTSLDGTGRRWSGAHVYKHFTSALVHTPRTLAAGFLRNTDPAPGAMHSQHAVLSCLPLLIKFRPLSCPTGVCLADRSQANEPRRSMHVGCGFKGRRVRAPPIHKPPMPENRGRASLCPRLSLPSVPISGPRPDGHYLHVGMYSAYMDASHTMRTAWHH